MTHPPRNHSSLSPFLIASSLVNTSYIQEFPTRRHESKGIREWWLGLMSRPPLGASSRQQFKKAAGHARAADGSSRFHRIQGRLPKGSGGRASVSHEGLCPGKGDGHADRCGSYSQAANCEYASARSQAMSALKQSGTCNFSLTLSGASAWQASSFMRALGRTPRHTRCFVLPWSWGRGPG